MLAEISDCVISQFGSIADDPYYDVVPSSMRLTNFETSTLAIKNWCEGQLYLLVERKLIQWF